MNEQAGTDPESTPGERLIERYGGILTDQQIIVVRATFLDEKKLSQKQIGEQLGIGQTTVAGHLVKAEDRIVKEHGLDVWLEIRNFRRANKIKAGEP